MSKPIDPCILLLLPRNKTVTGGCSWPSTSWKVMFSPVCLSSKEKLTMVCREASFRHQMWSSGWKPGFALGDTFPILPPWLSAGQLSFIILPASHGAQGLHNHSKVEVGRDLRKLSCPSPGSSSRVNYSRFPRTLSSWVFKISKAGSWGARA